MLRQKDILDAVISLIRSRFPCKVYADEVKENFEQPCFFIKLIKRKSAQTKSFNSNSLTIILTYFTLTQKGREIELLEVVDDIASLFGMGFQVGKRYLHVDSVSDERIGEKQDILQISIDLPYFDATGYDPDAGYEKILNIDVSYNLKTDDRG